jgi:hypothetical protein
MSNRIHNNSGNRRLIVAMLQLTAALLRLFDHHGWPW